MRIANECNVAIWKLARQMQSYGPPVTPKIDDTHLILNLRPSEEMMETDVIVWQVRWWEGLGKHHLLLVSIVEVETISILCIEI